MQTNTATARVPEPEEVFCAQCHTSLSEGQNREVTEAGTFCRPCFNNLRNQLDREIQEQSTDINYPMALVGGVVGGVLGILAWWGITVMTEIAFGIVAIVIGIAVGKGVTLMAGGKRSRGLQVMSAIVAALSFFYASYLVNRTFILQAFAERGEEVVLSLFPTPEMFFRVVSAGFGLFEVLFLGIVLYEAWKLPAPIKLNS